MHVGQVLSGKLKSSKIDSWMETKATSAVADANGPNVV